MRIAIVGAGVIGLALAYELVKDGAEVEVLDLGERVATSRNNAGWVVPAMAAPVPAPGIALKAARWAVTREGPFRVHMSASLSQMAFLIRMLRATRRSQFIRGLDALGELAAGAQTEFERYVKEGLELELHRSGLIQVFLSEKEFDHQRPLLERAAESCGTSVIPLDGAAARTLEPALSGEVAAALLCTDQYHVNSNSLIDTLTLRCKELGVRISSGVSVSRIATRGDCAVGVAGGEPQQLSDAIVIAAGYRSGSLVQSVGVRLPIQFGKGYGFDFELARMVPRHAIYLAEAKTAISPLRCSIRVAGAMEFGGKPWSVSRDMVDGVANSGRRYMCAWPEWRGDPKPWIGLRPMTPDGLPVIGRVRGFRNLYVASGHAMLGITLAPATARLLKEQILNGGDPAGLRAFDPQRFG